MAKLGDGVKFEFARIGGSDGAFREFTPEMNRTLNDPHRDHIIDQFLATEDLGIQNPGESAKDFSDRIKAKAESMLIEAGIISPKVQE
jgi:hypothetical protein